MISLMYNNYNNKNININNKKDLHYEIFILYGKIL